MNKEEVYFLKVNKYIRLKINKPTRSYRASISVNKYCWNEKENRYYEINFETFHPDDYKDEKEALEKAEQWLYKELHKFQNGVKEVEKC